MKSVFISFSEKDREKVTYIEEKLMRSKYLGGLIVADKNSNLTLISEKVILSIKISQYFISLFTANSIDNQWVNQELGYAKSLNKELEIVPIVDIDILDKLCGFINKEIDLPFTFDSTSGNSFESTVDRVINWLEIKNGKQFSLETIFAGLWRNDYAVDETVGIDIFEIKDGHWYDSGVKLFRLEDFSFNDSYSEIQFTKVDVTRERNFRNTLNIINNSKLVGTEDNGATVVYTRLPTPPINEFYKSYNSIDELPIGELIKVRLQFENGTTELKIGYSIGEIQIKNWIHNCLVRYHKFVDKIRYSEYLKTTKTSYVYLIPNFLIRDYLLLH